MSAEHFNVNIAHAVSGLTGYAADQMCRVRFITQDEDGVITFWSRRPEHAAFVNGWEELSTSIVFAITGVHSPNPNWPVAITPWPLPGTGAHPHAESMRLYAQDAAETDKPWERWELRRDNSECFAPLLNNPVWSKDYSYRRKPSTILVNGREVPAPCAVIPSEDTAIYMPNIFAPDEPEQQKWSGDRIPVHRKWLSDGLVHLDRDDAVQHAIAMLAYTTGGAS